MRHRRLSKQFSRDPKVRAALFDSLLGSLVEHERIQTTVVKAKELRRHVERAITYGKKGTLHARRVLLSRYSNETVSKKIIEDLSVRFKARPGGYTRIIKTGKRPGDSAEMAFIEFVDFDFAAVKGKAKEAVKAKKATSPKVKIRREVAQKKRLSKIQKNDRRAARA